MSTGRLLTWVSTTRCPDFALITGPGRLPLNVRTVVFMPGTISETASCIVML